MRVRVCEREMCEHEEEKSLKGRSTERESERERKEGLGQWYIILNLACLNICLNSLSLSLFLSLSLSQPVFVPFGGARGYYL